MTVEELWAELEKVVSSLANAGFKSIDVETVEKLEKFAATAAELGMNEGKRMVENLCKTMKAIQEGKSNSDSGSLRLTALDFYLKNHSANETVEDL
jgi:KaiC/GvpD/RAD55 family RecA-like ATPase